MSAKMSYQFDFLTSTIPLRKEYSVNEKGGIDTSSYPMAKLFNSNRQVATDIEGVSKILTQESFRHSALCKGLLNQPLVSEARAGMLDPHKKTNWVVLDFDGVEGVLENFIAAIPEICDTSYIVQNSASSWRKPTQVNCHVFFLLDKPIEPERIKAWLIRLNLETPIVRENITLSRSMATLHYPIDICMADNGRLIYISPPVIGEGVTTTPIEDGYFDLRLIRRSHDTISARTFDFDFNIQDLRSDARELLNAMRHDRGFKRKLPEITVDKNGNEIQTKVGQAVIGDIKEERGFVYFNINGGTNWSYYHPVGKPELILNFKNEPAYLTKELLPTYWKAIHQHESLPATQPATDEPIYFGCSDLYSARYHRGVWQPDTEELQIYKCNSERQINDWMVTHNRSEYDSIPTYRLEFNPHSNYQFDQGQRMINTFSKSLLIRSQEKAIANGYKVTTTTNMQTIFKVLRHATNAEEDEGCFEHYLNWLAVIIQTRSKTETAWVISGVEGTGKSMIIQHILAPIIGPNNVASKRASELEEKYNGWLQTAIIGCVEEIKMSDMRQTKNTVIADLKDFITNHYPTIRNMREDARQVRNFTNLVLHSNYRAAVEITDANRRYNYTPYQHKKLEISPEEVSVNIPKELPAFVNYMLCYKIDVEKARNIYLTNEAVNAVSENMSSVDALVMALRKGDMQFLLDARIPVESMTLSTLNHKNDIFALHAAYDKVLVDLGEAIKAKTTVTGAFAEIKISKEMLMVIFTYIIGSVNTTPGKFAKFLEHRNIPLVRGRLHGKLEYVYTVNVPINEEVTATLLSFASNNKRASKLAMITGGRNA